MSRTGRPTNDPKTLNTRIRLSEGDVKKLNYCQKVLSLTKSEIIRQGINQMYQMACKQK